MAVFSYLMLRAVAIALGLGCTTWSAYQSWQHNPWDFTGPLAAVTAAALFVFCERAARDKHWHHFGVLGVLGVLAATISGAVVMQRNAHTQAERAQTVASSNLPKAEARKALAEAKKALADAKVECRSGRGPRCMALELREAEARKRVTAARTELVNLGAEAAEKPVAAVIG